MASSTLKNTDKEEELDLVRNWTRAQLLEGELEYATSYTKSVRQAAKCQAEASRLQNEIWKLKAKVTRHQLEASKRHDAILVIRGERSKRESNSCWHADDVTCTSVYNSGNESDAHRIGVKRRRINEDGNPDQAPTKKPRKTDDQADGDKDSWVDEQAGGEDSGEDESKMSGKKDPNDLFDWVLELPDDI